MAGRRGKERAFGQMDAVRRPLAGIVAPQDIWAESTLIAKRCRLRRRE